MTDGAVPDELGEARAERAAALADADELRKALLTSRRIGMAMGILMERHRLTAEQAFERLRELSQQRNVKLRDVADALVHTGEVPPRPD